MIKTVIEEDTIRKSPLSKSHLRCLRVNWREVTENRVRGGEKIV